MNHKTGAVEHYNFTSRDRLLKKISLTFLIKLGII